MTELKLRVDQYHSDSDDGCGFIHDFEWDLVTMSRQEADGFIASWKGGNCSLDWGDEEEPECDDDDGIFCGGHCSTSGRPSCLQVGKNGWWSRELCVGTLNMTELIILDNSISNITGGNMLYDFEKELVFMARKSRRDDADRYAQEEVGKDCRIDWGDGRL